MLVLVLLLLGAVVAQPPVLGAPGTLHAFSSSAPSYSENFNTLAETGVSNVVPLGFTWQQFYGTSIEGYTADTGSSNAGNVYSYGSSATGPITDRSYGSLSSGGSAYALGLGMVNSDASSYILQFTLSFTCKTWRTSTVANNVLTFGWSTDATTFDTTQFTWTALPEGNCVAIPAVPSNGAVDGNQPANQIVSSATITPSAALAPGATIYWAWVDQNNPGNDAGKALDNLVITAQFVPKPVVIVVGGPGTTTTSTTEVTFTPGSQLISSGGKLDALNGTVVDHHVTVTLNGTFASGTQVQVLASASPIVGTFSNATLVGNTGLCQSASLVQTATAVSVLVSAANCPSHGTGLSTGAMVGIIVGSIAGAVLLTLLAVLLMMRHKKRTVNEAYSQTKLEGV